MLNPSGLSGVRSGSALVASGPPAPKPLVLVVDDLAANLAAMEAVLGEEPGWDLRCVASGEAALRSLLREDVWLVLLDVQMPVMDGYEVARLMRGNPNTRYTPIIFVSAIAHTQEAILRGYSSGAVDFMLKPFDPGVLRQKVHNLLAYERNRRELQTLSRQLESERAFNASVLANAAEGIMVVGEEGRIQYANPAMAAMTGRAVAQLHGSEFLRLLGEPNAGRGDDKPTNDKAGEATGKENGNTNGTGNASPGGVASSAAASASTITNTTATQPSTEDWRGSPFYQHWRAGKTYRLHEAWLVTGGAHNLPITLSCAPLPRPQRAMVVMVRDTSTERNLRARMESLIITDPLTGLLNRRGFHQALASALARARRTGTQLAVLYMDLDGFKRINDSLGHDAGDELLHHIAAQLKSGVRAYDSLARMGGDEFTVLLDNLAKGRDAVGVVEKLMKLISVPYRINDEEFSLTASVGIACYPDCGDEVEGLLRAADMAMYEAKHAGRQRYRFHTPKMTERAHARLELEQRLRQAIEAEHFALVWQPQFYLEGGQLRGFETLLRWPTGNPGKLMPDQFVPLLEETRLINPLGQWIYKEGIGRLVQLREQFGTEVVLSINVSPVQFAQANLVDDLAHLLHEHGIAPAQLEVEVTETVLMQNLATTQTQLRRLRALGIKIAVDDFGTGYSSLAYLRQFEVDTLKIDKLFVANLFDSPRDAAVVRTILDLSRNLGLETIAEGVETEAQRQWLLEHGCTILQGWLVAPALPFEQALAVPGTVDWRRVPLAG